MRFLTKLLGVFPKKNKAEKQKLEISRLGTNEFLTFPPKESLEVITKEVKIYGVSRKESRGKLCWGKDVRRWRRVNGTKMRVDLSQGKTIVWIRGPEESVKTHEEEIKTIFFGNPRK